MVAALAAPPLPLACVVHTGDLAERGDTQDLARAELSKLQLPLHVLPGNHDMMEADSAEGFVRRWGALSSSAEYQGVAFLMVYDHPTRDYDPLAWLEQALVQAGDKPVILFHHEPPVETSTRTRCTRAGPPTGGSAGRRSSRPTTSSPPSPVTSTATSSTTWAACPSWSRLPVSGRFGRQASFRIYEYDSGRLTYRTWYLEPE